MQFVRTFACPAQLAAGRFSRSRLRGTQGGRLCTTAQVWISAGLRDARYGRSKSRDLASNHGIAFRLAEPRRTMENPQLKIFALMLLLCHVCVTPFLKPSSSGSQGTSSSSFCNGHGRCISVCACL